MTQFNSQLKYRLALEWCKNNRSQFPSHAKFALMTTENLYALMESMGCSWSKHDRSWTQVNPGVATFFWSKASKSVMVRIIAHRDLIDRRIGEFIELSEALNWVLVRQSDVVLGNEGSMARAHLTFEVKE